MLRPLHIVKQTAPLMLAVALAVAVQAQPAPQAPAKSPGKAAPASAAKVPRKAQAPAKAPSKAHEKAPARAHATKPAPPKQAAPHHEARNRKAEGQKKEEPVHTTSATHGRDPFLALITGGQAHIVLPPGKAGLQVSTLRVDGIVRSQNGMIVVVLNPQGRTYFLHQGDRLFDGRVEQISMDAVTFQETGKDPFGNTVERTVVKRVYPSAGEQQ